METIKYKENKPKVHLLCRKHFAPEEIQHLQSNINYTLIYLKNGKTVLSSTTLKIIESRLLSYKNFVRINRQDIINQDLIHFDENLSFLLPDERILKFSRRKARAYLASIN